MTVKNLKEFRNFHVAKIANTNIINNVMFCILTNFTNGISFAIFGAERIPDVLEGN